MNTITELVLLAVIIGALLSTVASLFVHWYYSRIVEQYRQELNRVEQHLSRVRYHAQPDLLFDQDEAEHQATATQAWQVNHSDKEK